MNARMEQPDVHTVLSSLEKVKQTAPGEWLACCPAHEDNNPSLSVKVSGSKILLNCFAGCEYRDIAQAIEGRGVKVSAREERIDPPLEHFDLGPYKTYWDYLDARGVFVLRVCRWEQVDGRKEIRPLIRTPDGWAWKQHSNPRPLYQLNRLTKEPEKPVIIVEGEKAAVAAQKLYPDYIATTWPGGAKAVGLAEWSVLRGRRVTLIPDCDNPGRSAMAWVANSLKSIARTIRLVDPSKIITDLPEGWDLADALTENRDVSTWLTQEEEAVPRLISAGFTVNESRVHLDLPYLVKGIFDRRQLLVLWGRPGSGKTFIACHLAAHIGAGVSWVGQRVKKGRVLYICAESTRARLENRVSLLRTTYPELALSEVLFVPVCLDLLHGESDIEDVLAAARSMGDVALIVIDTLAVTMGGGDENGPEDMGRYVTNVKRIKDETGAAVLVVHHGGKDETRGMRGHSSLVAAIDAELIVEQVEAAPGQPTRILKSGKLREGVSNADLFAFDLSSSSLGIDPDGDLVTTCVVVPSSTSGGMVRRPPPGAQGKLLLSIETAYRDGGVVWTDRELRELAKPLMHRNSISKALLCLCELGFLRQSVGGFVLTNPPEVKT